MSLNILTFNWHEPYICNQALSGHSFFIVEPETSPNSFRKWDTRMRPVPENCQVISIPDAQAMLKRETFDLAIAHNVKDLIWLRQYDLPKICVFHCRLSTEIALSPETIDRTQYWDNVKTLLKEVKPVFISESKRTDWELEGEVIVHGIDVDAFPQYTGKRPEILRVGNLLKEMDLARGFSLGEKITSGFPSVTLGLNPSIPDARLSTSVEDLNSHYQTCRLYLNTTPPAYEDGYNLSLLEAMATGMPVIATGHPDSPVVNGVNGFISDDVETLRQHTKELLSNQTLAIQLGQQARETVRQHFPLNKFLTAWNQAIQSCFSDYLNNRGYGKNRSTIPFNQRTRKNVLMDFVSHPATTAHYLERAFRQSHNVMTCGATLNAEVIEKWDLKNLDWPVEPQDYFRGTGEPVQPIIEGLPDGWQPDFYFYVETGLSDIPHDLEQLNLPKVCYLIDTHLHYEKHLEIAKRFDTVFLAQKEFVEQFKACGHDNTFWLPLACDPEIHGRVEVEKCWDVGFVGSITPANPRRSHLLKALGETFDLHVERKFMKEMSQVFSESKIVFNNAIRNDLNMRVFEALCSGSLLVTDQAEGLQDLFKQGEHFALYQDDTLEKTVRYYLDNPQERERIAEAGRNEVLSRHTYSHRVETLLGALDTVFSKESTLGNSTRVEQTTSSYYQHVRQDLLPLLPDHATSFLEVGCGAGRTGQYLKENRKAFVAGVELNPQAAEQALHVLDDVVQGNIEELALPYQPGSFDCILCGDVLEHLVDPLSVLNNLKPLLKEEGRLVASIPNVQFFGVVHHLAEGNWTYQDEGILDRTHLRFFTFKEIKKLFEEAGFTIDRVEETLDPQYQTYLESGQNTLKVGRVTISDLTPEELKQFFVFQYRIAATPVNAHFVNNDADVASSDNFPTRYKNARELEHAAQWDEALVLYEQLTKQFPLESRAWGGVGKCQLRLGAIDKAKEAFGKSLELNRDCIDGNLGMGLLALNSSDLERAKRNFQSVLEIQPDQDQALAGLGIVWQHRDEPVMAMEYFGKALESNPENKTAMSSLLQLAYGVKYFEIAEKALRGYLEVHPANLGMSFGLAGIVFELGRLEEAKTILEGMLIFDPEHADACQLLEKIESQYVTP